MVKTALASTREALAVMEIQPSHVQVVIAKSSVVDHGIGQRLVPRRGPGGLIIPKTSPTIISALDALQRSTMRDKSQKRLRSELETRAQWSAPAFSFTLLDCLRLNVRPHGIRLFRSGHDRPMMRDGMVARRAWHVRVTLQCFRVGSRPGMPRSEVR